MKNTFVLAFIFFYCSAFPQSQENSLLWEIKGNGLKKPSYLYGTFHSKDARAHQFGDSVLTKLSKSDIVVVENIDLDDNMGKKGLELVYMKDKKLEDLLNHQDYIFIGDNIKEKMPSMVTLYNTLKPVITITGAVLLSSRQEMPYTVDGFIKKEAQKHGKELYGLETAEEAIQSMDEISLIEQSKMLLTFFKNYDKNILLIDSMTRIYQSQNLNKLYTSYMNDRELPLSFDKNLVVKRNKKFVDELIPLINKQSIFCAVGALHLPGEMGLINELRKKGYDVLPIYSKYHPKSVYIEDKREWYNYENDSLYLTMSFPNDPNYVEKTFSIANDKINAIDYNLVDSLHQLKYMVTIMKLPHSISTNTAESTYKLIIGQLSKTKNWKIIKESKEEYQELPAKELEFNITSGTNVRYKLVIKGGNLYLFGVVGFKNKLYSNISEHFFQGITLSTCTVEVEVQVEDGESHQPLNDFQISIHSNSIDTIIKPDTIGKIAFKLPSKENEYTITVISDNYVSERLLVNTVGINKTKEQAVVVPALMLMIKIKKGIDYSVFNKPISKVCLINDSTFSWDHDYIKKMKEEINRQFPESTFSR